MIKQTRQVGLEEEEEEGEWGGLGLMGGRASVPMADARVLIFCASWTAVSTSRSLEDGGKSAAPRDGATAEDDGVEVAGDTVRIGEVAGAVEVRGGVMGSEESEDEAMTG